MIKITKLTHRLVAPALRDGDTAVDATAGNGRDTLFLARLVGPQGRVYAFDVQEKALRRTAAALERENLRSRVVLIQAGHERMADYVENTAAVVMFNLGYLPGGGREITTRYETTVSALVQASSLLSHGGLISLVLYPGYPGGKTEREALVEFCDRLSPRCYTVYRLSSVNRRKAPPELILINKH